MRPHSLTPLRDDQWNGQENEGELIDYERILGMVRRQWRVAVFVGLIFLVLGAIYLWSATPLYTAQTSVLMDRGSNSMLTQFSDISSVLDDEGSVLSQVEILQSETIARSVVEKNKLDENPEFMGETGSILSSIKSAIRSTLLSMGLTSKPELSSDEKNQRQDDAVNKLISNIGVTRVGRTYVMNISYTSPSPVMSAMIANAIGDSYLTDKLDSKFSATKRATEWMQQRIVELRSRALETDLAVQKFRTTNNIVSTGSLLLTDQQLGELNSALRTAQDATAKARAKYAQVETILSSGDVQALVPEALTSGTVTDLRKKYLDVSKRQGELARTLGPNHIQVVRLSQEMAEYQRQMFDELSRIAQSAKSELDVASAQEAALTERFNAATTTSATSNELQVQLRELERESDTYRNLYQSFLDRYQQALQQQSFPVTDARIISSAKTPDRPSAPRTGATLAVFLVLGLAAGSMLGGFREFRDRFFRTGEQVRDELGLELLGIAPLVADAAHAPRKSGAQALPGPKDLQKVNSIANYVVDHPLSAFAEGLRSAKIAIDLSVISRDCKTVGIVSTLPDEGKSTVAVNLAELLASQGARTLLIDADLRNPGATRMLANHAQSGLLEVLIERQPVDSVLMVNPQTKLAFLPAVVNHRVPHSSELLNSPEMEKALADLSTRFDYIILDLPPLAPVVDARALAPRIDAFLFVVEWGRTARRTVRQILASEPRVAEKCVGVILNKMDMEKMKLYRVHGSVDYYFSRYSRYYQES